MAKYRKTIIFIFCLVLIIFVCLFYLNFKRQTVSLQPNIVKDKNNEYPASTNGYVTKDISIGRTNLSAEIADTNDKRTLGLGNRSNMPEDHGMLFVFDQPDRYGFWMKDTLIPLDMIWIDKDKVIITIKKSVFPSSFPEVFYPNSPALYVLEVNAGFAESHEIKTGMAVNF